MTAFLIPNAAEAQLQRAAGACDTAHPLFNQGRLELIAERIARAADWDFDLPARILDKHLPRRSGQGRDAQRRAAVSAFALALPRRVEALGLPASIVSLYPAATARLAEELGAEGPYDPDHFSKDVRFTLGLSVPAGGQVLDLSFSRAPGAALGRIKRAAVNGVRLAKAGDGAGLRAYLAARPAAPFLQIHTESRDLSGFNPDGWDRAYARAADLLERFPAYGGLLSLSWFYDPAAVAISPRLAYLGQRQLENGGVLIRLGSSPLQVALATAKSGTRRQMFEEGRYRPRCYAILWPRDRLIAWAREARANGLAEPVLARAA